MARSAVTVMRGAPEVRGRVAVTPHVDRGAAHSTSPASWSAGRARCRQHSPADGPLAPPPAPAAQMIGPAPHPSYPDPVPTTRLHRVAVLVLEGAKPLDVGIPAQVFTTRASMPYEVRVCGATPGLVTGGD